MGPGAVSMASFTVHDADRVVIAMMCIFTLVSTFVGGMNVAMDAVAGERERRSLVPLLLHPVMRLDLLLGKWLAVAAFCLAGLALNLAGFALLLRRAPTPALVFSPVAGQEWLRFAPIAGHQLLLEAGMRGARLDLAATLFLSFGTAFLAGMALIAAADRLGQDDVVHGG